MIVRSFIILTLMCYHVQTDARTRKLVCRRRQGGLSNTPSYGTTTNSPPENTTIAAAPQETPTPAGGAAPQETSTPAGGAAPQETPTPAGGAAPQETTTPAGGAAPQETTTPGGGGCSCAPHECCNQQTNACECPNVQGSRCAPVFHFIDDVALNFDGAIKYCEDRGGSLLMVKDSYEVGDWYGAMGTLTEGNPYWIGATTTGTKTWEFIDGASLNDVLLTGSDTFSSISIFMDDKGEDPMDDKSCLAVTNVSWRYGVDDKNCGDSLNFICMDYCPPVD